MKYYQLLCFLLLAFVFVSCTSPRYIHGPIALNTPCFQQKNDSKVGAFYSDNGSSTDTNYVHGYDLTAAYAISNHVALTASYHHRREQNFYTAYKNDPFDTSVVHYDRSAWEAGSGYFLPLDDRRISNISVYGGIGSENFSIREAGRKDTADYSRYLFARPFKFYVEPCFYFITASVSFAFMYRLNWVHYSGLQSNYTTAEAQTFHLDNLS